MKSCRRQNKRNPSRHPGSNPDQPASAIQHVPVRRYSHPIRIKSPNRSVATPEELLTSILESLSRQSELLQELLRRTSGDSSDTK